MLMDNGIKDVPSTVANPQTNAINECLHQTIEKYFAYFASYIPATES
jgi:transposase InsO family protein